MTEFTISRNEDGTYTVKGPDGIVRRLNTHAEAMKNQEERTLKYLNPGQPPMPDDSSSDA